MGEVLSLQRLSAAAVEKLHGRKWDEDKVGETLERLKQLGTLPDVEKEAQRTIQRAARDPAFSAFQKEAKTALGE